MTVTAPCTRRWPNCSPWTSRAKRIAAMLTGLDVHYDLGEGHPLLGRRMPDLDLATAEGPTRVYELLHDARPVLLNFGEPSAFDIGPWAGRVRSVDAAYDGVWELPVHRRGRRARRRADPPRRLRRLDRSAHRPRATERTHEVVRAGQTGVVTARRCSIHDRPETSVARPRTVT